MKIRAAGSGERVTGEFIGIFILRAEARWAEGIVDGLSAKPS